MDGFDPTAIPTELPPPPPPLTPAELAALPHDNAGPRLNATIWVLVGVSTAFLVLRFYCKCLRHRGLWWDDWILFGSWVCVTAQSCLLSFAVSLHYGKHFWDYPVDFDNGVRLAKAINVAGTLSLTAAVWSKTSFAFTLLRLSEGWMRGAIWFIIITMNVAMGLSALFIWVHCDPPPKTWNFMVPGTCWDRHVLVNYDIFSAAYSAAMDLTLAILPWKLIWGLQMRKQEKFGVALAMSCGIFAGITAIVKTTKIPSMLSFDPADGVDLFIWGNAESCVTIVAASIPVLRVLIREVRSSGRRYYISGGPRPEDAFSSSTLQPRAARKEPARTIVTVSGGRTPKTPDNWSDRSILDDTHSPGHIVQTREVAVEFEARRDSDSMFEMHQLGNHRIV
ncbi:integral membrane protein [Colletotrichum musicola]|uniref:Integral membrane protein n=1 Tax=Colletotrichum musicola TaxID=2175873 RepID=A0A8H6IU84_9PEZI|nr:integral membrane protein [Colletotrichum musicola]